MGALHVDLRNAKREQLDDMVDLHVVAVRTNVVVARTRVRGTKRIVFEIDGGQPYIIKAFPSRHRPVGYTILMPFDGPATAALFCPLDPQYVSDVMFPAYGELPAELVRVLDRSTIEGLDATASGSAAYEALTKTQRAGLLNVFAKMNRCSFDPGSTAWGAVERITQIKPDRMFLDVDSTLHDGVQREVAAERFREVSGKLHVPPTGFIASGSFKTEDRYGNLQLSFFASQTSPVTFKVDADIDDAAGLGHAFQVLRNFVTSGTTHPYDIHQILTFRQEIAPLYDLA